MTPGERASVADAARAVLDAADPAVKVKAARAAARALHAGRLALRFDTAMPDRPARPDRPLLLPPGRMPKRGRGGSLRGRIALLHAIAHIECVAIDLAFDMAGRFGGGFPPAFVADWFRVGAETRHWRRGEAFVFDDTIEHEAMNPSDRLRVVLIFDLWHPDLSEIEREAVAALIGSDAANAPAAP